MQKTLLAIPVALIFGAAAMAGAADAQVQRKSTLQETYTSQPQQSGATGTSAQGPNAGVQTPVGGAQVNTGNVQTGTTDPATQAAVQQQNSNPVAQRTVTTEETILAQQNPPIRWSVLEGEVTHVDKANNVVEIRLKGSKQTVGIPVIDKRVGIYRHGDHQYALNDIKPGHNVTLRNLNTAAQPL
jgi:hypothetical protein